MVTGRASEFGESMGGASVEKGIWISVRNWETCLGRTDVKHNQWFRCSNRILEDDDFIDFSLEEICVWIHVLSLVSLKKSGEVFLNFESAQRKSRLSKKLILSAIAKLEGNQLDRITIEDPSVTRPDHVRNPCTTGQDRQDIHTNEHVSDLNSFAEEWNTKTKDLPKIKTLDEDRKKAVVKFLKKQSFDDWVRGIAVVEESEFLSGRSGKWAGANFDWLLNPKNFRKVIEGNYADKNKPVQTFGGVCAV